MEFTDRLANDYRNLSGFTMIKTGLAALVVVGGDDSNTNAAFCTHCSSDIKYWHMFFVKGKAR